MIFYRSYHILYLCLFSPFAFRRTRLFHPSHSKPCWMSVQCHLSPTVYMCQYPASEGVSYIVKEGMQSNGFYIVTPTVYSASTRVKIISDYSVLLFSLFYFSMLCSVPLHYSTDTGGIARPIYIIRLSDWRWPLHQKGGSRRRAVLSVRWASSALQTIYVTF